MRTFALQTVIDARALRSQARAGWLLLSVGLVVLIALADWATGIEVSLSVLYLGPVVMATWVRGLRWGIAIAALASGGWYLTFVGAHTYSHPMYLGWEALIRASTAVVFAVMTHRLRVALSHSDERFVKVLEGIDAAVYVASIESESLLYVNDHCRRAFGGAPRSLNDIERGFAIEPAGGGRSGQREVRHEPSGKWFLVNRRPLRWIDGTMVDLYTATDLTQLKDAERLAQDRQERLEMTSRLATAGEIASTLAHELNHPLASILNYNTGCAALLQSGTGSTADVLEGLEKSSEQAQRAGAILQQVREFIARREPKFGPCFVAEVIRDSARLMKQHAARSEVQIRLDLVEEGTSVHADKVMLQQLVLNLAKNAIEAMATTTLEARQITLACRPDGGSVLIEVADRGPGLPAELESNLFVPFFTTKPDGMGLGLQICRSVSEYHDGRLSASARPGGGALFQFRLPARQP